MAVWPSTLDESISAGQAGHITDHQTLHGRWNALWAKKVTSAVTLTSTLSAVIADTGGGAFTITLPGSTDATMNGKMFAIKRTGANTLTVNTDPNDQFDDGTTGKSLFSAGAALGIVSVGDGNWYITGTRGAVG